MNSMPGRSLIIAALAILFALAGVVALASYDGKWPDGTDQGRFAMTPEEDIEAFEDEREAILEADKAGKAAAGKLNSLAASGSSIVRQRKELTRQLVALGVPKRSARVISKNSSVATVLEGTRATTKSHLGGKGLLPKGVEWPKDSSGHPLDFYGAFDFDELPRVPGMPAAGTMLIYQLWTGDDPDSWSTSRVFYVAAGERLIEFDNPRPTHEFASGKIERLNLKGRNQLMPPYWEKVEKELGSTKALDEMANEMNGLVSYLGADHQLGGGSNAVQGAAELTPKYQLSEASSATRSRLGDVGTGPNDWRLLVQINEDQTNDMYFADGGSMYCVAPVEDVGRSRFDRAYCYWDSH